METRLKVILDALIEVGEEPVSLEDSIMNIPLSEKRFMELYIIYGDSLEIVDLEKHNNILFKKKFNDNIELEELVKEFISGVKNQK